MSVYLGSLDALVTEHLLHLANAGATSQQVRSKRVTEDMGADRLIDAGTLHRITNDVEDHHTRQGLASIAQKDDILILRALRLTTVEVEHHTLACDIANRHKSLFIALTQNADIALAKEQIRESQRGQLRDSQTTRIE